MVKSGGETNVNGAIDNTTTIPPAEISNWSTTTGELGIQLAKSIETLNLQTRAILSLQCSLALSRMVEVMTKFHNRLLVRAFVKIRLVPIESSNELLLERIATIQRRKEQQDIDSIDVQHWHDKALREIGLPVKCPEQHAIQNQLCKSNVSAEGADVMHDVESHLCVDDVEDFEQGDNQSCVEQTDHSAQLAQNDEIVVETETIIVKQDCLDCIDVVTENEKLGQEECEYDEENDDKSGDEESQRNKEQEPLQERSQMQNTGEKEEEERGNEQHVQEQVQQREDEQEQDEFEEEQEYAQELDFDILTNIKEPSKEHHNSICATETRVEAPDLESTNPGHYFSATPDDVNSTSHQNCEDGIIFYRQLALLREELEALIHLKLPSPVTAIQSPAIPVQSSAQQTTDANIECTEKYANKEKKEEKTEKHDIVEQQEQREQNVGQEYVKIESEEEQLSNAQDSTQLTDDTFNSRETSDQTSQLELDLQVVRLPNELARCETKDEELIHNTGSESQSKVDKAMSQVVEELTQERDALAKQVVKRQRAADALCKRLLKLEREYKEVSTERDALRKSRKCPQQQNYRRRSMESPVGVFENSSTDPWEEMASTDPWEEMASNFSP